MPPKQLGAGSRPRHTRTRVEIEEIVDAERDRDDERLADFNAIYAGEDVDAVGAERREERHVQVVQRPSSKMDDPIQCRKNPGQPGTTTEVLPHLRSTPSARDARDDRNRQLVSPSDVEDVVQEPSTIADRKDSSAERKLANS